MNKEDAEKIKEDLERLKSMSPEDAKEIVMTYHKTFLNKMSDNIDFSKTDSGTLPFNDFIDRNCDDCCRAGFFG
jgi:hypothetical protein